MKIAFGSDIHAEFEGQKQVPLSEPVDVLVLAGDITKAKHLGAYAAQYLDQASFVVVVLGNHERWGEELNGAVTKARENLPDRVHVLENSCVEIMGTKFIGATAWTDFRYGPENQTLHMLSARGSMNDYKKIKKNNGGKWRKLIPEDTLRENAKSKDFIFSQITPTSVVITHHAPTHLSIPERHKGDRLNACYVNQWGDQIAYSDGPQLWIHGHIHDQADYMVGDTRVLCNPVGYPGQIPDSGFKFVEI